MIYGIQKVSCHYEYFVCPFFIFWVFFIDAGGTLHMFAYYCLNLAPSNLTSLPLNQMI